jgi:hypothetical protein
MKGAARRRRSSERALPNLVFDGSGFFGRRRHSLVSAALTLITAPTPAGPATDPSTDYREHFEALTGLSLREYLHCRSGIMW